MNQQVSVIIATYNRENVLCETIEQIRSQDYNDFFVHIVDHTTEHSPETEKYLASLPNRFNHHKLTEGGLCTARNYGLQESEGDIVIYIDDDVRLADDFISSHVAEYDDPKVGAVAGQVLTPRHPEPINKPPVGRITWYGRSVSRLHSDRPGYVGEGRGCNMSFRRELLEAIGGFDTNLEFRDESDVFHRLRDKNYVVRFSPSAGLYHKENESGGTMFNDQRSRSEIQQISKNKHYFHLKNKPLVTFPAAVLTSILYRIKVSNGNARRVPGDTIQIILGALIAISDWIRPR